MLINRRTIRIELETAIPQVSCSTQGILSGSMHCAAALFEAAGFLRGDLVARQGMVIPMVDTRSRFLTPF
jgi:hypothetical protein